MFITLISLALSAASPARASDFTSAAVSAPGLGLDLDRRVCAVEDALALVPDAPSSTEVDWELKRFWLRVRLTAGVKVPWLATAQLQPEVELLWEKAAR